MNVNSVMTKGAECASPSTSLQEAARKMKTLDVGSLPVCGDGDRLVGVLTDRDIAVRAVAEGLDAKTTQAKDVMTPDVVYCFEDQDVRDAAKLMQDRQVRRLVVLDRDKRLVGIVSLGDLAVEVRDDSLTGKTLEHVSEPARLKG